VVRASIAAIGRIELVAPQTTSVTLHHATLYAVSTDRAVSADNCASMPDDATPLYVWSPGAAPITFAPPLQVPAGTTAFVVQAHAMRSSPGAALTAAIRVQAVPEGTAAWRPIGAPVPAIRPRHRETMTWSCAAVASGRTHYAWPHMHRLGRHIGVTRVRGAQRDAIVDIDWNVDAQEIYPREMLLERGDRIEVQCTWENPTDEYVLPGLLSTNEMCNVGLVVSPAAFGWVDCR